MMNLPYVGPVGPLNPGYTVRVSGTPPLNAQRFAVNLQCGPNTNPRDDVAFHLSIDFLRRAVIRNSIQYFSWGPEETDGKPFPFNFESPFTLDITYNHDEFKVNINGLLHCTFVHRIPPTKITHVAIDGDLKMASLQCLPHSPNAGYGAYPSSGAPMPPYPTSTPGFQVPNHSAPYSTGPPPYPSGPPYTPSGPLYAPSGPPYAPSVPPYPTNNVPYSTVPGAPAQMYSQQPQGATSYHSSAPYPQQPNYHQPMGTPTSYPHSPKKGMLDKVGALAAGTLAGGAVLGGAHHMKKKMKKKHLLKYGLPVAGVGLGAYALKKSHLFGHHGSSSSSSSSSSSDSD